MLQTGRLAVFYITDTEIDRFLQEDLPYGDLTTRSLGISHRPAAIAFRAGATLVACSTDDAARILARLGCATTTPVASGETVSAGDLMLSALGPAGSVLAGWKVAQTLMEYASGIATATARIVVAARTARPDIVVACTRKVFPGTKAVAVKAIIAGGAVPHRLGLSDSLLVFPEHCVFFEGSSLADAIRQLKTGCPEKKVVVEVTSLAGAEAAAAAGAEVIQLEKFTPELVATTAERLAGSGVLIAAAGGINDTNAAVYAAAGAHILVTSAPYSAPPIDVKVNINSVI